MREEQGYLFGAPTPQPSINLPGLVRRSDPRTSREAAEGITPVSGQQRNAIMAAIAASGAHGMTAAEIDFSLRGRWPNPGTRTPRIAELQVLGLVSDSGKTRPSPSGRRMIVWVAR